MTRAATSSVAVVSIDSCLHSYGHAATEGPLQMLDLRGKDVPSIANVLRE